MGSQPPITLDVHAVFRVGLADYLGLQTYCKIVNYKGDVSKDKDGFQKWFNGYYGVRCKAGWRKKYYALFQGVRQDQQNKADFNFILTSISQFEVKNAPAVAPSFASKMLATVNLDMPIWDSRVLNALRMLQLPAPKSLEGALSKQLDAARKGYEILVSTCNGLLESNAGQDCVNAFNIAFPKYECISDMKKLDFALWCMGVEQPDKKE